MLTVQQHLSFNVVSYHITSSLFCIFYLINKQFQDKGGDAAVDPDEEVDGGQKDVGRAGDGEHKGSWVHQGSDWPPEKSD